MIFSDHVQEPLSRIEVQISSTFGGLRRVRCTRVLLQALLYSNIPLFSTKLFQEKVTVGMNDHDQGKIVKEEKRAHFFIDGNYFTTKFCLNINIYYYSYYTFLKQL
jgi:hypothetical protein